MCALEALKAWEVVPMRPLIPAGCLLVLVLALMPARAAAYPIPPQTIWDLVHKADLIVLARVVDVGSAEAEAGKEDLEPWFDSDVAVLEVIETWKGTPEKQVSVAFTAGMICPAPPSYIEGRRVVAFLARREEEAKGRRKSAAGWYTVGLSYGTRYPASAQEELSLAEQARRAVADQQGRVAEEGKRLPSTSSWALRAAADRATRWDGLYALSFVSDPSHAYYDRGRDQGSALSPAVLAELELIMVQAPSFDRTLPQMLRLLRGRPSAAVTNAAVNAIETILRNSTAPSWMDETIDLLVERLGQGPVPDLISRDPLEAESALVLEPFRESAQARKERVQKRWEAIKRKAGLKPQVLEDFQREVWTGTGGQTPP